MKRLKTIPKPYVPIKEGDIPKAVADLVLEEYTRSCITVAVSRPQRAHHPGWGTPGSQYEGIRFRNAILDTIADVDKLARTFLPDLPPLRPHRPMIDHLKRLDFVLLQNDSTRLRTYHSLVEQARYDEEEPTEADWEKCQEVVGQLRSILKFYIEAGAAGGVGGENASDDLETPEASPVPPPYAPLLSFASP
ncbi:hypothetical protein FRB99_000206 [Tulasnella sp. 403]|nr:hypothetical protein FRB99_000206 [Tulasnella sp. 403]